MAKSSRRVTPHRSSPPGTSVKLFISYSHVNRVWMERLQPVLRGFQYDDRLTKNKAGLDFVHAWHDTELKKGVPWDGEIKSELDAMDIFVPLISADFFASWYIQNVELKRAEERHLGGSLLVVPILLYDTNVREKCAFLHQFPTFPRSDHWWSKFPDYCDAHRFIDDGLWEAIKEVVDRKLVT